MSRIQFRRGPATEWASVNPVLGSGEPGYETDTGKTKWGDGVTHWNDLEYAQGEGGSGGGGPSLTDDGTGLFVIGGDGSGGDTTIINNYSDGTRFGICQSELAHGSYTGFETDTKVRQVLQGIQDSGATYIRVAAWWNVIEPIKDGGYSWTGMDRFMNAVDDYGLTPLVCMTEPAPTGATIADFGQLCGAIAGRYGSNGTGQLKHYEVWNEENNVAPAAPFNTGGTPFGPATYTALLIAGTTAIRAQDPQAVVLLGGLMSTVDYPLTGTKTDYLPSTFLQGIYDNGGGDYFDVFNAHWYSGDVSFITGWEEPRTDHPVYLDLTTCREKLIAHGDEDKEFWITEMGFPISEAMADPVVRARWTIKQIELIRNLGFVDVWFLYNYKNAPALADGAKFGIVDESLVKYQPLWDMIANINAVSPAVPTGSVVDDTIPDRSIDGVKLDVAGVGGSGKFLAYAADGALSAAVPPGSGGGGSDSGMQALGELYEPMLGVWPAVDAVNGPLTSDVAITNSAPSFTGLKLVPWNSGKFNVQSQNWVAVPTSNGPTTNQCCANVTTPRGNNYASTGLGFPCHSDTGFVVDTMTLIVAYWVTTTHAAALGVTTPYHEVQLFAEHEGQMKGVREAPAVWPHASGGGNQMFYKKFTFSKALRKEYRLMLSAGCWLAGVYVDTAAQMTKSPNRPVLMGCFGDSWGEGQGNVFSFFGGNGAVAGVTWPTGCSMLYSNTAIQYAIATGFAIIIMHEGGTGYFNANGGSIGMDDTTGTGFTVFGAQIMMDFFWTTFGSRSPCVGYFGGWNDGAQTTSDTQTRADHLWRKAIGKDATIPILVEGIQNVRVVATDGHDTANTGLKQAAAALQTAGYNLMGFIDNLADSNYQDMSTSGYNNIGPDTLHPTVKGGNLIGVNRAKRSATFPIPRDRVLAMLAA